MPQNPFLIEIFAPLAFLLGLIMGSFGTACVHRWLNELSLIRPLRSICPDCGAQLAWWENVPLVSWLLLRGRCSHCGKPISLRYPALELLSGLWALALAEQYGPGAAWAALLVLGGMLLIASFIDLESFLLPDVITLPGTVLALLTATFLLGPGSGVESWLANGKTALLGAAIGGGFFWLLRLLYQLFRGAEGLGLGDVKLMLLIGALVGPQGLPLTILLSGVSALLASILYLLRSGKGGRTPIPFGPF
ncbi:MAG: prepilin peptidase, partial [Desulfovibrionaceae bacterium]